VRRAVAEAPAAAARYRDVENAAAEAPRLREEAARLSRDVAAREEEVARLAAEQAERPALEATLAALAPRLRDASATEQEAARDVQRAAEAWGAAKREVARLEREAVLLRELEGAAGAARRRLAVDEYLAEAFGPNGIPALMTERALAELEEEANAVLARLTGGRMTVQLATERERKAGGTTETLDVVIAEAGYPRPYESFSGGEAFRVDFALRLGLARLVARRAETPLRFLVLDEGFGTQDEEGMATLVEVIGEVRDDFDKIFVISHLPELRDRFPARVEVWRDARGWSRFRLAA